MKNQSRKIPKGQTSRASKILQQVAEESPFFLTAMFCLTERCNLQCPHCLVVPPDEESTLSVHEITGVLKQLEEMGVFLLSFTGGEPVLYPFLKEIVAAAANRKFLVKLKTNAALLGKDTVTALFDAGLSQMDISLYSDQPAEHNEFVKMTNAWENVMMVAETFHNLGGSVKIAITALNWNQSRLPGLIELCENADFTYSITTPIYCRNDGDMGPTDLKMSAPSLEKLLDDERLLDKDNLRKFGNPPPDRSLCKAGLDNPIIMPNGDVKLCQRLPWAIGNVLEKPIREIWDESEKRKWFTGLRWKDLPVCSECDIAWACARCPATALLEEGDILAASESDCQLARAQAAVCLKGFESPDADPNKD